MGLLLFSVPLGFVSTETHVFIGFIVHISYVILKMAVSNYT